MGETVVGGLIVLISAICLLAAGGWWMTRQAAELRRERQKRDDALQQLTQLHEQASLQAAAYTSLQQRVRVLEEEAATLRAEAELRGHQLEDAEHAVAEANRTKSLFVANMSHELRTPLNGILGLTRSLLDADLSPRQQSEVELIQMAGEDLMRIVNDVLDLSKLEASKLTLEKIPFHLGELLEGVFRLLYPQAARKHLVYALSYAPTMRLRYLGDPFRLRQVVLNLLANAIKFTPSGHVFVHATEVPGTQGRSLLVLDFIDSGIGIGAAKQRIIFEEFEQADLSTTRRYGGTGLGLSISRRIIRLMEGDVTVESESGRGSTFRVSIPLQPITLIDEDQASPGDFAPGAISGVSLLVQQRHSPEMIALQRLLDVVPNLTVEHFQNAGELLSRLQQQQSGTYDAIVTGTGALAVWDDAVFQELDRQGPAGPPLIVLRDQQADGPPDRYPAVHRVEIEPPVLPSQLFHLLKQLERKPLGPLFEAAGMTAFDLFPDSAPPRLRTGLVLVAHESPVERRRLEGLAQKLGLNALACGDAHHLARALIQEPVSAAIVQASLLTTESQVALWRRSARPGGAPRLLVTGPLDAPTRSQLSASSIPHRFLPESPRLAQLRDALMTTDTTFPGRGREDSGPDHQGASRVEI